MSEEQKKVEETKEEVVEQLEEKTMEEIDELREEGNEENEKIVDDAQDKIKGIFDDLRTWVKENSDPETIKEKMNASKDEIIRILEVTKEKAIEVSNSDHFKQTVEAGKSLVEGSAGLIADGFKAGADLLMSNENIADLVNKADSKLDVLRESEGLQKTVDAAEELTGKVNEALFGGLRKFFEKKADGEDGE